MSTDSASVIFWVVISGKTEELIYVKSFIQHFQTIALPLRVMILSQEVWHEIQSTDLQTLSVELDAKLNVFCDFVHLDKKPPQDWLFVPPFLPLNEFEVIFREYLPSHVRQEIENQAIASWLIYSLREPPNDFSLINWQRNPGKFECLQDVFLAFRSTEIQELQKEIAQLSLLRQELAEKEAQIKRIMQSEEYYRRFFEEDMTGDFLMDCDWRIVECNTSFVKIFGFPSKSFAIGFPFRQVFPDDEILRQVEDTIQVAHGLQNFEMNLRRQNGQKVNVIANFLIGNPENKERSYILGFLFDNTLHKSLEHQLRESQRMEGLGRLAGGVAHDFNNILTVINGYSELLLSEFPPGSSQARDVATILEAGQKAAALTSQLLAFSRRQMRTPENCNINHLILGMEVILRRLLKESISLNFNFDQNIPNCLIDKAQFEQALMNLCLNAQDAMPDKGVLTIGTKKIVLETSVYDGQELMLPGTYVELSVNDTGLGIPGEVLPHIFEPFYTTKEPGKGTGLGLATVYGIVQQNHAHITVESQEGKGSTFRIFFPAHLTAKEQVEETETRQELKKLSILLVEDDIMIREYVTKILSRHGHNVQSFSKAEDLLNFFGVDKVHWNLLITDVVMPGMSGPEMVNRLREMGLNFPVLFISGYPDNELEKFGIEVRGRYFLNKPFKSREFLDKIAEILGTS
jgi:two-component system cell cycle sensor histidine kinase/response regulator CckA